MAAELTHFDEAGASRMVDVGSKPATQRLARASGRVTMAAATAERIRLGQSEKGNVLEIARIAGIMGAKRTADLIPLCHPLGLTSVTVDFEFANDHKSDLETLIITAAAQVTGQTGVEMEALTAVSVAGLTVYDMCKAIDRGMTIQAVRLEEKQGGKSGTWLRSTER